MKINCFNLENLKDLSYSSTTTLQFSNEIKLMEIAFDQTVLKMMDQTLELKNAILKVTQWTDLDLRYIHPTDFSSEENLLESLWRDELKCLADSNINFSWMSDSVSSDGFFYFKGYLNNSFKWFECRLKNPEIVLSYDNQLPNLFEEVQRANFPAIGQLINEGTDLNHPLLGNRGSYIDTDYVLISAAKTGNIDLVRFLVEHGANVNVQTYGDGETPLICAFRCNDVNKTNQIAKYLVEKGADIDIQGGWCQTALMQAVGRENQEMVKFFIAQGANVNLSLDCIDENECRSTPIHQAIYDKNAALTELLISLGARLDLEDSLCELPFHTAVNEGNQEICQLLLNHGADINQRSSQGKGATPLYDAVSNEDIAMVNFLIKHAAKVNLCGDNKETPLHRAMDARGSGYANLEMAKLLLDNGAFN